MDWLLAVPAWGERYVRFFVEAALPGIEAASARCNGRFRFVVHTDDPGSIKRALTGKFEFQKFEVPKGENVHSSFGEAHRKSLELAEHGECVAFINADMVPSVEIFAAAEKRFEEGKRMIIMAASRTIGGTAPIGAKSADLLRWTMEHRHPAIVECFWGTGKSRVPWAIYFESGDDIVLHGFHLHPFAVMKDRKLSFKGTTIDSDLGESFTEDQIHVVTDVDEAAFAEHSPPDRVFKLADVLSVENVAAWARRSATPLHRKFFKQRIVICGDGKTDIGDHKVCNRILKSI